MKYTENDIQKRIKLGYTREEAIAELQEWEEIDKTSMGELMTKEEKESLKNATKGAKSSKPKAERKPREKDKEKLEIVAKLNDFVKTFGENVTIINDVKEISFTIGENDYSISLIKHRPPKKSS